MQSVYLETTLIGDLPLLVGGDGAKSLADLLLDGNAVPRSEPRDRASIGATHLLLTEGRGFGRVRLAS